MKIYKKLVALLLAGIMSCTSGVLPSTVPNVVQAATISTENLTMKVGDHKKLKIKGSKKKVKWSSDHTSVATVNKKGKVTAVAVGSANIIAKSGKSTYVCRVLVESKETSDTAWINSGIYGTYDGRGEINLKDDFAAAVNRDWATSVTIREGEVNASARTEQTDNFNAAKLSVLTGERKDDPDLTSLQNYYALLMDWDTRNAQGFETLKPYIDDLLAINTTKELNEYFADPARNLYGNPMVNTLIAVEPLDPLNNMLTIRYPTLLSDEPKDYAVGVQENEAMSRKRQTAVCMLKHFGYNDNEANHIFDSAKSFEAKLVPGMEAIMADDTESNIVITTRELENRFKNIPYAEIFRSLGYNIDLKGKVAVNLAPVFDCLEANYTDENIRSIRAWVLVHTLLDFTKYGDMTTYEETSQINGVSYVKKDERYALDVMEATVPSMIDQMYINYCFDTSIRHDITDLTEIMLDNYREMIKEEDWLSDTTKEKAIEKLDNFKINICYPDNLQEARCEAIKTAADGETALSAIIKGRRYFRMCEAEALTHKNDGSYWRYDSYYSTLSACYFPQDNSINIFAGICGGDYYDKDWPIEKKLGGLCMVVGHEITHAFDASGADYDKDGAVRNWWTEADRKAFQTRIDKLDKFYSTFVPMPQISNTPYGEDGAKRVHSEAIADLGSLKCLLKIAKKYENFDYDTFFKQLAVIQKQYRYLADEQNYADTNEHPVDFSRANIPLQNYDEFIKFYDIKPGDGMYLASEDRITVW